MSLNPDNDEEAREPEYGILARIRPSSNSSQLKRIAAIKRKVFSAKPFKFTKLEGISVSGPRPRSGHRTVADVNGCIYSFGGYNPEPDPVNVLMDVDPNPLFQELWKFNPYLRLWKKLETQGDAPTHLASHCAILFNKSLVIYGGTGVPFGMNSSNKVHVCNLNTSSWTHVQPTNHATEASLVPMEQYGQAMCAHPDGESFYVIGGTTGFQYTIDIHRFDFRTKRWEEIYRKVNQGESFPEERYRHEVVLYDDKIFIIGGGTAAECYTFRIIPVFNLKTRTWEQLAAKRDETTAKNGTPRSSDGGFPHPRRCHGSAHDGQFVYVIGGTDGEKIFGDVWRLDLLTLRWVKLPASLPKPVYFHATSLSPSGQLVVFGGVDHYNSNPDGSARTNEMYSIWLGVPSLKELTFSAFMHYYGTKPRKLAAYTRQDLIAIGIPREFVNRIRDPDFATSSPGQPSQPPPPF